MSHRTQITLADEQYERLRAESEQCGLGLAELVRRAVDQVYGTTRPQEIVLALEASFGGWGESSEDGESYVDQLRPGVAHRLAKS